MATFRRGPANRGKNRDFPSISGFDVGHHWTVACCQHFDSGIYVIALMRRPSPVINKRHRATQQWILFRLMTRSDDVTPKTTERYFIVRIGKSEAAVTNNKRLRSTYCTVKAMYWKTRSIAQSLCNSRVSCLCYCQTEWLPWYQP